ncbi:hypothetical protein [Roseivirga sp.]|uniref:hypothetical protein n=1 Tax=Roseivirga sp. TaxID=1964215 RepID=UPI003B526CD0
MRSILLFLGIAIGVLIVLSTAQAQEARPFIYGEVETIEGDTYKGPIRWGSDEVYWVELFNATKTSNDFMRFLSKKEVEELNQQQGEGGSSWLGIDLGVISIWEDRFSRSQHQLDLQFGDIKSVEPSGRSKARITLKNGVIIEAGGSGYEDVGGSVVIYDFELGEFAIRWDRIKEVRFLPAPAGTKSGFGEPIYGVVNAGRKGTFKGLIQWDSDERFMDEILNGEDRDGKKDIPFKSIKSIAKKGNGVDVVLHSGRDFYLTGSNDVNRENRGVVVFNPEIGRVVVPWRDFYDLEIVEPEATWTMTYDDFPTSRGLSGTVVTIDGEEFKGLLAYDLDEAWEFEILDANDDDVSYQIPLRNVKNIIPKNYNYSSVILRNGTNLLLGGSRDVSDDNDGILIFTSKNADPIYVRWSKIDQVIFD